METVLRIPGESSVLYTVCTFNLLTLMVRHGRVMLQIEKLLIAGAVEITFVF